MEWGNGSSGLQFKESVSFKVQPGLWSSLKINELISSSTGGKQINREQWNICVTCLRSKFYLRQFSLPKSMRPRTNYAMGILQ